MTQRRCYAKAREEKCDTELFDIQLCLCNAFHNWVCIWSDIMAKIDTWFNFLHWQAVINGHFRLHETMRRVRRPFFKQTSFDTYVKVWIWFVLWFFWSKIKVVAVLIHARFLEIAIMTVKTFILYIKYWSYYGSLLMKFRHYQIMNINH